jgi:hypothetical protein
VAPHELPLTAIHDHLFPPVPLSGPAQRLVAADCSARYALGPRSPSHSLASADDLLPLSAVIPAGFHFAYSSTSSISSVTLTDAEEKADVLKMSRGVAVILLVVYLAYLVFQMWSHADLVSRPTSLSDCCGSAG